MSDRVDQKLTEVAVARYVYRHEAEFAAGFLEDADIPFRLQVDDPALGLAISGSATIWVLAMHADAAREVLELDANGPARLSSGPGVAARRPASHPVARSGRAVAEESLMVPLSYRERLLALLGGVGVAALGRATVGFDGAIAAKALIGAVTVLLVLTAVFGRAPRFLRDLLAAITGGAP